MRARVGPWVKNFDATPPASDVERAEDAEVGGGEGQRKGWGQSRRWGQGGRGKKKARGGRALKTDGFKGGRAGGWEMNATSGWFHGWRVPELISNTPGY